MKPNKISKINTAAAVLEKGYFKVKLFSMVHVLHSLMTTETCCPCNLLQEYQSLTFQNTLQLLVYFLKKAANSKLFTSLFVRPS